MTTRARSRRTAEQVDRRVRPHRLSDDFRPTAETVDRHIARHKLAEACRDGDVRLVCDLLREQMAHYLPDEFWLEEVAAFLRRGCTKLSQMEENRRTILRVARELEDQARRENRGKLRWRKRPKLLDEVREQFDGEPMPERRELLNDLERGPRAPRRAP
jgi:hypothetical protein